MLTIAWVFFLLHPGNVGGNQSTSQTTNLAAIMYGSFSHSEALLTTLCLGCSPWGGGGLTLSQQLLNSHHIGYYSIFENQLIQKSQ